MTTTVNLEAPLSSSLSDGDRTRLKTIQQCLPLLADVARADVILYSAGSSPGRTVVVAYCRPATAPPLYEDQPPGRLLSVADEPAVSRALTRGKQLRRFRRVLPAGQSAVQDVFPIWNDGRIIGALSVEVGHLESERQKRKSVVFRRAVAQVKSMVINGQLEGANDIGRLGEHDGALVVDSQGYVLYIGSLAEQMYRRVGYSNSLLRVNLAHLKTDEIFFAKSLEQGRCLEQITQVGERVWVKRAIPLLPTGRRPGRLLGRLPLTPGEISGVLLLTQDLTQEWQREQEMKIKSAMIQEIHHRVKNNLQTIAALLRMQARRTGSVEAAAMLEESINRILSIAVVHDFLAHAEAEELDMREVIQRVVGEISRATFDPTKKIVVRLQGDSAMLSSHQATSCAMIVNELLHNAVEHGFADRSEGEITINLRDQNDWLSVEIVDDGLGLPAGDKAASEDRGLGLQIVKRLVSDDLKGIFSLESLNGKGVRALVSFPSSRPSSSLSPGRPASD